MTEVNFGADLQAAEKEFNIGAGSDKFKLKEGENRIRILSRSIPLQNTYKGKRALNSLPRFGIMMRRRSRTETQLQNCKLRSFQSQSFAQSPRFKQNRITLSLGAKEGRWRSRSSLGVLRTLCINIPF